MTWEGFLEYFRIPPPGWIDLLDIIVLSFLIYQILMLIRGTRAVQWIVGAVLIVLAYWISGISHEFQLKTVHRLLGQVLFYIPFAIIVIFQNTIRRALANFGRNPFFRLFGPRQVGFSVIDEITLAATTLASRRIGGLIVIEREQGLRELAETGIELDAAVSYDLLVHIFAPRTPLHDGAVIIREDRIQAASCFLPLTANPHISKEFGTRLRGGIGVTEDTDAIAVVISEERGNVSAAVGGRLSQNLNSQQLREFLVRHLEPPENPKEAEEGNPVPTVESTDESRL
ncbi:MAG: diadenylate cyclase CdaA [Acidobacteriota bacterium]